MPKINIDLDLFHFIQWNDINGHEETGMKKDIEWLKKEFDDLFNGKSILTVGKSVVDEILDQLDELEVTHEQVVEWIENNEFYCHATAETVLENAVDKGELGYYGTKYVVVEKPVIPKFVAEWIESRKNNYPFDVIGAYLRMNESSANEQTREVLSWVHESELNRGSFARAWLDGFTVEKEQKYYVLDSENIPLLERANNQTYKTTTGLSIYEDGRDNSRFELTEQEIKDYDPRYMAFAKPVEELD